MKKMAALMTAVLLVIGLMAGCGEMAKPLPEGMDKKELNKNGLEICLRLVSGDFEGVHGRMREDQQELYSVEDIQKLVLKQLDGAGTYENIKDTMVTGQEVDGEKIGVAVFYCMYSEEKVLIRVAFDPDMNFVGFSVQQDAW